VVDLLQAVTTMAAGLLSTEILLVGDHVPPLWSKQGRHRFTPGQVSWVRSPRARRLSTAISRDREKYGSRGRHRRAGVLHTPV